MNQRPNRLLSSASSSVSSTLALALLLLCGLASWSGAAPAGASTSEVSRFLSQIDQIGLVNALDHTRLRSGTKKSADDTDQPGVGPAHEPDTLAHQISAEAASTPTLLLGTVTLKHNPSAPRAPPIR